MQRQKNKNRSELHQPSSLLPVIQQKLSLYSNNHSDKQQASEGKHSLRLKVQKEMQNNGSSQHGSPFRYDAHVQPKQRRKSIKQNEEEQKNKLKIVHYQSTPKLTKISPQKIKTNRLPSDRYLRNQKLSLQLNLPKNMNHSFDSEEEEVHKAILQQDKLIKVEPVLFVLKKNQPLNKFKAINVDEINNNSSDSKIQLNESKLALPSIFQKSEETSLNSQSKSERFIKERFVGKEAVNKFYDRYKNIEKIREREHFKLQLNPLTTILTILQHYSLPPKRMEVIKLKGEEAILDLKNCALGSGVSIKAISEIIEKIDIFQQVDLSYNQITPDLTDFIIPNLGKMLRINLSYNKIGRRGIELLTDLFWNEESPEERQLELLNLQSNNINDTSFGKFFDNIINMNSLMVLNLSKNFLGNTAASKLKHFFMNDSTLAELYLHWCQLGIKATKMIFEGLAKNLSLKVLDISWNQIGLDGTVALCKFIKHNITLLHLDISYCEIDHIDTQKIAKSLKHNQSIYGIHYEGNKGFIDFKGNLHVLKKQNEEGPLSIRTGLVQRIDSINIKEDYTHHHQHSTLHTNICWICEGWQERTFRIAKEVNEKACFLHLDFEHYTGVLMHCKDSQYQLTRMCPPNSISFFFTKVPISGKFQHFYDPVVTHELEVHTLSQKLPDFLIEKKKFSNIKLQKINKLNPPPDPHEIFDQYYQTKIHCQPRSDDMKAEHLFIQKPPRVKKPKKVIVIPPPNLQKQIQVKNIPSEFQSVFKAEQTQQCDEFTKQCVQFDINNSKVTRLLKTEKELQEIKQILYDNYQLFQKIYYHLASHNPNHNGVYSISEPRFEKFIEEQSYETKRVTMAKIRIKLVAALTNTNTDTDLKAFYRPQFFEFLLRLAIEKWCPRKQQMTQQEYYSSKNNMSIAEAFTKMLHTLRKYEQLADSSKWREQNLSSYDLTIVIKSYSHVFQQIYEKYAGLTQKNMNTRTKKRMLLEQIKILMLDAEIRKTKETLKDLEIAYRTAKKLEVEDGISDTGLDYLQFLETFCRFAEGIFFIPIGSEHNTLWEKQLVEGSEIPLFLKVEKLLQIIYFSNYSLRSKKYDTLFSHGLFPEQISMLMAYFKGKYEHRDHSHKSYLLPHAKLNNLLQKKQKITLQLLIEMVAIKAAQIQAQNRQKILQLEEERARLERQAKENEEKESSDSEQIQE